MKAPLGPCRDGLEGVRLEAGRPGRRLGPGVMERIEVLAGTKVVGLDSGGNRVRSELHLKMEFSRQTEKKGHSRQDEPCVLKPVLQSGAPSAMLRNLMDPGSSARGSWKSGWGPTLRGLDHQTERPRLESQESEISYLDLITCMEGF